MTKFHFNRSLFSIVLLLSSANLTHAATVTVSSVFARTSATGTAGTSGFSQSGLPVAVSNASIGGGSADNDAIEASAYQHENGVSYVRALASAGQGYSGNDTPENGEATTVINYNFFNDGPDTIWPIFNFLLSSIEVSTFNAGGATPTGSVDFAAYSAVDNFQARVEVVGIYDNAIVRTNNVVGNSVQSECVVDTCYRTTWTGSASGSISVGAVAPGDIGSASVVMIANNHFMGFEDGASAQIWDPNGGSIFTYTVTDGVPVSPVPLPASGLLLLGALSLGSLWRRKRGTH